MNPQGAWQPIKDAPTHSAQLILGSREFLTVSAGSAAQSLSLREQTNAFESVVTDPRRTIDGGNGKACDTETLPALSEGFQVFSTLSWDPSALDSVERVTP